MADHDEDERPPQSVIAVLAVLAVAVLLVAGIAGFALYEARELRAARDRDLARIAELLERQADALERQARVQVEQARLENQPVPRLLPPTPFETATGAALALDGDEPRRRRYARAFLWDGTGRRWLPASADEQDAIEGILRARGELDGREEENPP